MREQLTQYIDLLFAGAPHATDIKQEILQNTLDRYDDLIDQGKSPQAAYQLAISGIGDINEILGNSASYQDVPKSQQNDQQTDSVVKPTRKKILQAIGVCLYILCPLPLFILQDVAGLCGLLVFVAVATALMVISGGKEKEEEYKSPETKDPDAELRKAVRSIISVTGLCIYFAISFATQAWYITWIIFPLIAAVQGLVTACLDLKEANQNEA